MALGVYRNTTIQDNHLISFFFFSLKFQKSSNFQRLFSQNFSLSLSPHPL